MRVNVPDWPESFCSSKVNSESRLMEVPVIDGMPVTKGVVVIGSEEVGANRGGVGVTDKVFEVFWEAIKAMAAMTTIMPPMIQIKLLLFTV